MNGFLWVAGDTAGVSVTHTDRTLRPKTPIAISMVVPLVGAQPTDFKMGWLPYYPARLARLRPVHPGWIGTDFAAVNQPSPSSWLPNYPRYLAAPRLHRTFYRSVFDPQSGEEMRVAASLAWDPRKKAPLVVRPKRARTQFAYTTDPRIIAGGQLCVEMVDTDFDVPTISAQSVSAPAIVDEALTRPSISEEDFC